MSPCSCVTSDNALAHAGLVYFEPFVPCKGLGQKILRKKKREEDRKKKAGAWENFPSASLCNSRLQRQMSEVCPLLPTPGSQKIDGCVLVSCSFHPPPHTSVTLLTFILKRWQIHKYLLSAGSCVRSVLSADTALPSSPLQCTTFMGLWGEELGATAHKSPSCQANTFTSFKRKIYFPQINNR